MKKTAIFLKRKNLQLLEVKKACGRKSCLDPDFLVTNWRIIE